MKKLMFIPLAVLLVGACSDTVTAPDQGPVYNRILSSHSNTHVTVALSAAPYTMCMDGGNVQISGSVTVTNTGANPTENLEVLAMIQGKNPPGITAFEDAAAAVSLANSQIAGGANAVYQFSIVFDPSPYSEFRMRATADITNQSTGGPAYPRQSNSDGFLVDITQLPACAGAIGPRGIGYWKNHETETIAGLPVDLGVETVTTFSRAYEILEMAQGQAFNGIEKLMAQLLAARLNEDAGACGFASVADTADDAEAFLTNYGPSAWTTLDDDQKDDVEDWKDALDTYNNSTCS